MTHDETLNQSSPAPLAAMGGDPTGQMAEVTMRVPVGAAANPLQSDLTVFSGPHLSDYANLDSSAPLLLLPVRLETKFFLDESPPILRIRVYPDQIHVQDHAVGLTADEIDAGKRFWEATWRAGPSTEARGPVLAALAATVGPWRALYIARNTRPSNDAYAPKDPVLAGDPLPVAIQFLAISPRSSDSIPHTTALPDRWAFVGVDDAGESTILAWGNPIPASLDLTPAPLNAPSSGDGLDIEASGEWLVDFPAAVSNGMAVEIELTGAQSQIASDGLAELHVLGIKGSTAPDDAAARMAELFAGHYFSRGMAVIPQGTPTNNTEDAASGVSFRDIDFVALYERALDAIPETHPDTNARLLAKGLGLGDAYSTGSPPEEVPARELLDRLEYAYAPRAVGYTEPAMEAMNTLLWPVTGGEYLAALAAGESTDLLSAADINYARNWFINHVRGGANFPVLRIGRQPYGLLPARLLGDGSNAPNFRHGAVERTCQLLRTMWHDSAATLPLMDPLAINPGGNDERDGQSDLVEVIANQPHPWRFNLRGLQERRASGQPEPDIHYIVDGYQRIVNILITRATWYQEALTGHDDSAYEFINLMTAGLAGSSTDLESQEAFFANLRTQIPGWKQALENRRSEIVQQIAALEGIDPEDVDLPDFGETEGPDGSTSSGQSGGGSSGGSQSPDTAVFEEALNHVSVLLHHLDICDDFCGYVQVAFDEHRGRLAPLNQLGLDSSHVKTALGDDGPAIAYSTYMYGVETWPEEQLVGPDVNGGPPAYLGWIKDRIQVARNFGVTSVNWDGEDADWSNLLLFRLLKDAVDASPAEHFEELEDALAELNHQPADGLTRLMRETLGLTSHRLDAWITSLAIVRLNQLRAATPEGVHLGGFGWVENLRPEDAPESHGFIHAPSLNHAATAAVMRAGWLAHGSDEANSPLAIDVSSARTRLANWLLDGVRQGQDLGDMLGYRFERLLHDRGKDQHVAPIRKAVLAATGSTDLPLLPVDGLDLRDLYQDGLLATSLTSPIKDELNELARILDALADATLTESIHHLVQGNVQRAGATLEAITSGEAPAPELIGLRTPRSGMGVNHRICVALDGDSAEGWSAWKESPRSVADPALESLAAALFGPPERFGFHFGLVNPESGQIDRPSPATLADVGLSALDALYLVQPGHQPDLTGLVARIRYVLGERHLRDLAGGSLLGVDPLGGEASLNLAEFALLAGALRSLVASSRSLRPADLATDSSEEAEVNGGDLEARAKALAQSFNAAADALLKLLPKAAGDERPVGEGDLGALRAVMARMASFDLTDAIPRAGFVEDEPGRAALYAQAWSLAEKAVARQKALSGLPAIKNEADRLTWAESAFEIILGRSFPLLPRFTAPDAAAVVENFGGTEDRLGGDRNAAFGWLQSVGRVRGDAARLNEVATLAELVAEQAPLAMSVAQFPDDGEPWVGLAAPQHRGGVRTSLAACHVPKLDFGGRSLCGLFIDQWMDRIPNHEEITGVSFHFDSPGAQPPQTLLLAVPPEGSGWDFATAFETVRQTLAMARERAVGAQDLHHYGHHLPAVFARGELTVESDE